MAREEIFRLMNLLKANNIEGNVRVVNSYVEVPYLSEDFKEVLANKGFNFTLVEDDYRIFS